MGVSVSILVIVISLHLVAFVLAVGAERRRSTAKVVPDKYDEKTYCAYESDASTMYGLAAFGLLFISQMLINGVTRCLCFGSGMMDGRAKTCSVFFFVLSWVSFLAAEACMLAGSARNAYHTKYHANFHIEHLSCATLRKGVFAAGASLTLLSMIATILYYWAHSKADTGGWEKHKNEGLGMTSSRFDEDQHRPKANEFEKKKRRQICSFRLYLYKYMVSQLRGAADIWDTAGGAAVVLWGALLGLLLVAAVMFSCSGGASPDKASATNNDTYGGAACAAACGGACGG